MYRPFCCFEMIILKECGQHPLYMGIDQNILLDIPIGYILTFQFYNKFIINVHHIRVTWMPQSIYQCVWDLLGMCSSLCFGTMVTAGLLTDLATLPLFRSALDADWVMVRMLFPRGAGGWKFVMLPFRLGDGVWMEASWLVMSLSCSSGFGPTAASGACSLAEAE